MYVVVWEMRHRMIKNIHANLFIKILFTTYTSMGANGTVLHVPGIYCNIMSSVNKAQSIISLIA